MLVAAAHSASTGVPYLQRPNEVSQVLSLLHLGKQRAPSLMRECLAVVESLSVHLLLHGYRPEGSTICHGTEGGSTPGLVDPEHHFGTFRAGGSVVGGEAGRGNIGEECEALAVDTVEDFVGLVPPCDKGREVFEGRRTGQRRFAVEAGQGEGSGRDRGSG